MLTLPLNDPFSGAVRPHLSSPLKTITSGFDFPLCAHFPITFTVHHGFRIQARGFRTLHVQADSAFGLGTVGSRTLQVSGSV
jgi:hypothetical protein